LSNNFALMIRVIGDVSAEQLADALARIRPSHPSLLRGPDRESAALPLEVRADCADDDWIAVAAGDLRTDFPGFPEHGAVARFTCLKHAAGFDLVAAFHHGAADGISGVFVLRDILLALTDPQARFEPLSSPPWVAALVPAAVQANAGLRRRVDFTAAALRARVRFESLRERLAPSSRPGPAPAALPGAELPPNEQYIILPARLTSAQTTALLARCKKEGVSVHAAVCAAWLRAFTAETKARFGTVSSPVNMRDRVSAPVDESAGVVLATLETRLDCAHSPDFWDLARAFKQELNHGMSDENLFFGPMLMAKAFAQAAPTDRRFVFKLLFDSPVSYDFSITNIGRIPIQERYGALQVEACYGPLVNSSEHERTVGVSTLAGRLGMTFNLRRSKMEPAQAKALLERVVALLVEAAG